MSEQHRAFQRLHVEKPADESVVGLLEQLGLPPEAIGYIRKNKKNLWISTGCIAALIVAVSLFGSYTNYRDAKAASALTVALNAGEDEQLALLDGVIDSYSSTPAGTWARIEKGHIAARQGDIATAISQLEAVGSDVAGDDPVKPLLLAKLAGLYEQADAADKALAAYTELAAFKGFGPFAQKAMGRLYERQNEPAKALAAYRKYLEDVGGNDQQAGFDPEREMIEARVAALSD